MANYEIFDITDNKVGDMTQEELDEAMSSSQSISGSNDLAFYQWDTTIYDDMSGNVNVMNLRFAKPIQTTDVSGSESDSL